MWYEVRAAINNRESLFRQRQVIAILRRMFGEARGRFVFESRGIRLEKEWLSFYIKPADRLQLPAIMQWLKQRFAVRFNRRGGGPGVSGETDTGQGCWKGSRLNGRGKWIGRRWIWRLRREESLSGPACQMGSAPWWRNPRRKPDFRPKTSPDPRHRPAKHPKPPQTPPRHRPNHPAQRVRQWQRARSAQASSPAAFQKANANALQKY
jgi:hypothetical protein